MAVVHNSLHRFIQGVTNHQASHPLGLLTIPDVTEWSIFFDDFMSVPSTIAGVAGVEAGLADVEAGHWTLREGIENSVDITQRAAVANSAGVWDLETVEGIIEGDTMYMDIEGAPFKFEENVPLILETRFSLFAATTTEGVAWVGLADGGGDEGTMFDSTEAALTSNNCFGFVCFDASNNIHAVSRIADAETRVSTIATSGTTALRFNTLTMAFDGQTVRVYANGVEQANTISFASLPTVDLTPCVHIQDGAAEGVATVNLDLDYILVAKRADRRAVATA